MSDSLQPPGRTDSQPRCRPLCGGQLKWGDLHGWLRQAQSKGSLSYNEGPWICHFAFCAGGPAVDYSSPMPKMCRVFSPFVLRVKLLFIYFSHSQPGSASLFSL